MLFNLFFLFNLFYCRQSPCLIIICGHGQKWIFSFCLGLLIPPWQKWTLNHTLPLQMVEWKFSSFFFFCHCLSECGVPTHTKREYKLSTSLGCTDTKDGGRNRGSTLTTLQSHVPPSCCYVSVKFQLSAPLRAKLTQEGEKQSVHLPCLMPYHSVSLLMSGETQLCAGLPTVLCWHGGRGRGSGGGGGNATLLAPSCSASSYLIDVGQEWKPTSSLSSTDSQAKNSWVLPAPAR